MKTTIGALRGAIKKAIKATETASCSIKAEGESLKVIAASAQGSIMIDVPVEGTASCSATISLPLGQSGRSDGQPSMHHQTC